MSSTATPAAIAAAQASLGSFAAIASGGLGVASAITGANAQADAYEANAEMANRAKMDEDRMIGLREAQEQEKAAQAKIAQDLETQQIASRVQATDSGGFLNNNAVMQDIVRQGLVANNMTTQNLERTTAQLGEDRRGASTRAQSRINSVSRPNRMATGLQIGSSALNATSQYSAINKK
tara:strand:- start:11660 stop:12196 length:537 start_codon:yes stop_codon:yes gene_type:complete